jgi:hypothetical protein
MAVLLDIFDSVQAYLSAQLSVNEVKFAYRDDRVDREHNFPEATINLIGSPIDGSRRYGGFVEYPDVDAVPEYPEDQVVMKKVPIPINLQFQVDTFCENPNTDVELIAEMMGILGGRLNIPGPDDSKLQVIPMSADARTTFFEPGLVTKAYRFYIPIWIDHPDTPTDTYIVKSADLDMNARVLTFTEP